MYFNQFINSINLIFLLLFLRDCDSLYTDNKDIAELTPTNFNSLVLKGDEVWIVKFYAPWCAFSQNAVPEYTKLARILKGIIKVGVVNVDEYKELAAIYNIRSLPAIKIFGANKQKPEDFHEGKNAKEMMEVAMKAARATIISRLDTKEQEFSLSYSLNEYVTDLSDKNFDKIILESRELWMVVFYTPWCSYCRSLEPHWNQAAAELKDKIRFGRLDGVAFKSKCLEYKVTGYPTIKLFVPGNDHVDYDGSRKTSAIVTWASERYEEHFATPIVHQLTDEPLLIEVCKDKNLAVVAFLPSILDCQSFCRKNYIALLGNLAVKFKKNKWCWLWSEAAAQPEIEKVLRIGGSGYPALAAVNHHNKSYSIFIGALTENKIYDFLWNFNAGKGTSIPIKVKTLPEIYSIDPWNEKDSEVFTTDNKDEL